MRYSFLNLWYEAYFLNSPWKDPIPENNTKYLRVYSGLSLNEDSKYVIKNFMSPTEKQIMASQIRNSEFRALRKTRNGYPWNYLPWNKIRTPCWKTIQNSPLNASYDIQGWSPLGKSAEKRPHIKKKRDHKSTKNEYPIV